ncbi:hypothetical protein D3C81_1676280 [compost metagenome]
MRYEIARPVARVELLGEDAFPRGAAGTRGARQAADQRAIGQPGQGPALHRGGADVEDRNRPEQLTETVDLLIQQTGHGLGCAVAAGEPGAARDQHHLDAVVGDPVRHLCADLVQVILEQVALAEGVAGFQQTADE